MPNKKVSIGLFSLTSCEGCYFSVIDLAEKFLALTDKVELKSFRLFEEGEHELGEKFDIAFVEGSPITAENFKTLQEIRKNSKILVATGSCAHLGGIYHMKNYQDKDKLMNYIYEENIGIENPDIKPIGELVDVDFILPGCPITGIEFLKFVDSMLIGKRPHVEQNPVCYECQKNGYECLLQKGEICLGPITQAGCGAVCLKSKQACWGCRGLVEDAEVTNLLKELRKNHTDKEILQVFEVFGVKELI